MGTAFAWIVDRLRWALAGAAGLGLLMVYWGWSDAQRIHDVESNGIEATAQVQGATRTKSRRGGETYSLKLAWRDAKGGMQSAERVKISSTFAQQIIIDDRITRQTVRIKYLAEATIDSVPLVLEDATRQEEQDDFLMKFGFVISGVGMVGSGLFFLVGRWRQNTAAAPPAQT